MLSETLASDHASHRPGQLGLALAVPLILLAAATLAVAYLQDVLGVPNPSAVYLLVVVVTAFVAGTGGAVLASIASALVYDYLFTEPRYTFTEAIDDAVDLGAEMVRVSAEEVVGGVELVARSRRATHLVIPYREIQGWRRLVERPLGDQLLERIPELELHVVAAPRQRH